MSWDEEFDVVCVGSGVGGLTTAVTASHAGATVLLVEKESTLGGVTARSGGQMWVGASHLEADLGIDDTLDDTESYLESLSEGYAEPVLRRAFVETGPVVIRFMTEELGLDLRVIRGLPDYYHPRAHGSRGEGRYIEIAPFSSHRLGDWAAQLTINPYADAYTFATFAEILAAKSGTGTTLESVLSTHKSNGELCAGAGLTAALLECCLARGVDVRPGVPALRLITGTDGVEGIVIEVDGRPRSIRARRGVMLATGGYDWNRQLVRTHEGIVEMGSMTAPTVEGDHLVMAADVGALPTAARLPSQTPLFVGYAVPGLEVDGFPLHRSWSPGHPHSMIVNRAGQRFADDGFYPDVVAAVGRFDGGAKGGPPNWPAWLVFDQNFIDKYGLPPSPPGADLPAGLAESAPDLETLADRAGVDPAGLIDTARRMNQFSATGEDIDFGRGSRPWSRTMIGDPRVTPNPNLAPIDRPPFYAVKLTRVGMGVPTAGLRTDEVGQVTDARGEAVIGLYAVGNAAAWLDIGAGINSGLANTRGMAFGFLAARKMTGS